MTEAERIERQRREDWQRAAFQHLADLFDVPRELLGEIPTHCTHPSATGVDMTPIGDPSKVWCCDGCGFKYRTEFDGHVSVMIEVED